jgi:uncharacterized membrane protein
METLEIQEIKKEFQLERIIFFSDAVFAIIITIMVLDIRLPEGLPRGNSKEIEKGLLELVPKTIAYAFSFLLVSRFWMSHIKIFGFVKDYTRTLIIYNLCFLFCVSLFPFTVSLISGKISPRIIQYTWGLDTYIGVIFSCFFMQTLLVRYLMRNQKQLCQKTAEMEAALRWKVLRVNFYCLPALITVMILLNYFGISGSFVFYPFLIYLILLRKLKNKYYPKDEDNGPVLSRMFSRIRKKQHAREIR